MNSSNYWVDTHAHVTSNLLKEEAEAVIERAHAAGVKQIINICTDAAGIQQGLKLGQLPDFYNAGAVHPHDVEKEGNALFPLIVAHAQKGDFIAVGETGLDYHYHHSPASTQQEYLRKHLQLATACRLPVIIHCREAFADLFQILDAEYPNGPGVLHCFTGTSAEAEKVISKGFYLSISGIVTFKKSVELREIAKWVPLDRLLLETDAPFLAPQNYRGKPNEPAYLIETAAAVAAVKGITLLELAQATSQNASTLFRLDLFRKSAQKNPKSETLILKEVL